jgi:transitional endoplasmic reticulum ATPase
VVFIDEVEEIAGLRQPRTVSVAQGVTNEMLKLIPPFREQDERLLICATNSVRDLDTAFLRHGRFDYLIPVGPPDDQARHAIWDRYLAAMQHAGLDLAAIVERSRLFTPADIEFAARRTPSWCSSGSCSPAATSSPAQQTSCAESGNPAHPDRGDGHQFEQDIKDYARL